MPAPRAALPLCADIAQRLADPRAIIAVDVRDLGGRRQWQGEGEKERRRESIAIAHEAMIDRNGLQCNNFMTIRGQREQVSCDFPALPQDSSLSYPRRSTVKKRKQNRHGTVDLRP